MALIHLNHLSMCSGNQRNLTVILPTDGMDQKHDGSSFMAPGMKYQTLWLLHGGGGDDSDWVNFSNIVRYANEHRIAVVMPAGTNFVSTDFDYVTRELPALLRTLLPLSAAREDNFIGGLSHGGDAAMRACFEYPDRYAGGLIMSAAGTDHKGPVEEAALRFDVYGCAQRNLDAGAPWPKLIFGTGTADRGMKYYVPVIDKLEAMGVPLTRYYVENDGHSWDFWDGTVRLALREMLPIRHDVISPA